MSGLSYGGGTSREENELVALCVPIYTDNQLPQDMKDILIKNIASGYIRKYGYNTSHQSSILTRLYWRLACSIYDIAGTMEPPPIAPVPGMPPINIGTGHSPLLAGNATPIAVRHNGTGALPAYTGPPSPPIGAGSEHSSINGHPVHARRTLFLPQDGIRNFEQAFGSGAEAVGNMVPPRHHHGNEVQNYINTDRFGTVLGQSNLDTHDDNVLVDNLPRYIAHRNMGTNRRSTGTRRRTTGGVHTSAERIHRNTEGNYSRPYTENYNGVVRRINDDSFEIGGADTASVSSDLTANTVASRFVYPITNNNNQDHSVEHDNSSTRLDQATERMSVLLDLQFDYSGGGERRFPSWEKVLLKFNSSFKCTNGPTSQGRGIKIGTRNGYRKVESETSGFHKLRLTCACSCARNRYRFWLALEKEEDVQDEELPATFSVQTLCLSSQFEYMKRHFVRDQVSTNAANEGLLGYLIGELVQACPPGGIGRVYLKLVEKILRLSEEGNAVAVRIVNGGYFDTGRDELQKKIISTYATRLAGMSGPALEINHPAGTHGSCEEYTRLTSIDHYKTLKNREIEHVSRVGPIYQSWETLEGFLEYWGFSSCDERLSLPPNIDGRQLNGVMLPTPIVDTLASTCAGMTIFLSPHQLWAMHMHLSSPTHKYLMIGFADANFHTYRIGAGCVMINFSMVVRDLHPGCRNRLSSRHLSLCHGHGKRENWQFFYTLFKTWHLAVESFTGHKNFAFQFMISDLHGGIPKAVQLLYPGCETPTDAEHVRAGPRKKWLNKIRRRFNAIKIEKDLGVIYRSISLPNARNMMAIAIHRWRDEMEEPDFADFMEQNYYPFSRPWHCAALPYPGFMPLTQTHERHYQSIFGVPRLGRAGAMDPNQSFTHLHTVGIPSLLSYESKLINRLTIGRNSEILKAAVPFPVSVLAIALLMDYDTDIFNNGDFHGHQSWFGNGPKRIGYLFTPERINDYWNEMRNLRPVHELRGLDLYDYHLRTEGLCFVTVLATGAERQRQCQRNKHLAHLEDLDVPYHCTCIDFRYHYRCGTTSLLADKHNLNDVKLTTIATQRYSGATPNRRPGRRRVQLTSLGYCPVLQALGLPMNYTTWAEKDRFAALDYLISLTTSQLDDLVRKRGVPPSQLLDKGRTSRIMAVITGTKVAQKIVELGVTGDDYAVAWRRMQADAVTAHGEHVGVPVGTSHAQFFDPYPQGRDLLRPAECKTFFLNQGTMSELLFKQVGVFVYCVAMSHFKMNLSTMHGLEGVYIQAQELTATFLQGIDGIPLQRDIDVIGYMKASVFENAFSCQNFVWVPQTYSPVELRSLPVCVNDRPQVRFEEAYRYIRAIVEQLCRRPSNEDQYIACSEVLSIGRAQLAILRFDNEEDGTDDNHYEFQVFRNRAVSFVYAGSWNTRYARTVLQTKTALLCCLVRHWEEADRVEQRGNNRVGIRSCRFQNISDNVLHENLHFGMGDFDADVTPEMGISLEAVIEWNQTYYDERSPAEEEHDDTVIAADTVANDGSRNGVVVATADTQNHVDTDAMNQAATADGAPIIDTHQPIINQHADGVHGPATPRIRTNQSVTEASTEQNNGSVINQDGNNMIDQTHRLHLLRGTTWWCFACQSETIQPEDAYGIPGCPTHSFGCYCGDCARLSMLSNNTSILSRCPTCRKEGRLTSVVLGVELPDPRTEQQLQRIRQRETAEEID